MADPCLEDVFPRLLLLELRGRPFLGRGNLVGALCFGSSVGWATGPSSLRVGALVVLGCAFKCDRPSWRLCARRCPRKRTPSPAPRQLRNPRQNSLRNDPRRNRASRNRALRTLPASLRTTRARLTYAAVTWTAGIPTKRVCHKNGEVSLRLPFSHPCGLIASDPFTDVSVTVSQGESCPGLHPTVDRLAGGPWPSPYWVGGLLGESRASRVQACTRPSTGSLVARGPLHTGVEIPKKNQVGPTCTVTRDTQ